MLITFALFAVVLISLAVVAFATGWDEIFASIKKLMVWQILLLAFLSCWNYVMRGLRWALYNRTLGLPLTLVQSLRHYLAGLAMTVTPGRVGELVRIRWIQQETGWGFERTAPLVLVDRAADLAAIGLLLSLCLALGAGGGPAMLPVAALSIVVAILATRTQLAVAVINLGWRLIGRMPRLFATLRRAARTLGPYSKPQVVIPALILGGIGWFAEGYSFHLLLGWLDADIGLWSAVAIFLVATVTGGATGAPGGLGGAEAAMVALLSLQGIPLAVSIPATAIIRLTTLWFALAIGLGVFPFATKLAARGANARQA